MPGYTGGGSAAKWRGTEAPSMWRPNLWHGCQTQFGQGATLTRLISSGPDQ